MTEYDPKSVQIKIDGHELRGYAQDELLGRISIPLESPSRIFFSRQLEPCRDIEFNCEVCGCLIVTSVLATTTHASGICRSCFDEWKRTRPFVPGFHGYHHGGWQSGPCQCTPCEERRAIEALLADIGGEA